MEELIEKVEELKTELIDLSSNTVIFDEIRQYIIVNNLINLVAIGYLKKEDLMHYQDFSKFISMLEDYKN